jgi:hypothetical protein
MNLVRSAHPPRRKLFVVVVVIVIALVINFTAPALGRLFWGIIPIPGVVTPGYTPPLRRSGRAVFKFLSMNLGGRGGRNFFSDRQQLAGSLPAECRRSEFLKFIDVKLGGRNGRDF